MPSKLFVAGAVDPTVPPIPATTVSEDVFTAPQNKVAYITQLIIDNTAEGVNDISVTIQDSFTPDVTNGVAVPAAVTQRKVKLNAPRTELTILPDSINSIKILNTCQIVCYYVGAAANTNITVVWE